MKKKLIGWGGQIALQSTGPMAAFVAVWYIARIGGPILQGEFAQHKAFVELLFVLGSFGFPQAIVYLVNKIGISVNRIISRSFIYSIALIPIFWVMAVFYMGGSNSRSSLSEGGVDIIQGLMLAVAAAMLVLHGLWRAVYLSENQRIGFALFTILPSTLLLAVIYWTVNLSDFSAKEFPRIFLLAYIVAAFFAGFFVFKVRDKRGVKDKAKINPGELFRHGVHSFMQGIFIAAQPLVAYEIIKRFNGGQEVVGIFNMGVLLLQGSSVPVAMIAPLLFAMWTKESAGSAEMIRISGVSKVKFIAIHMALGLTVGGVVYVMVPYIFGNQYTAAALPAAIMLLGFPFLCHSRVLSPAFHSEGNPTINTKFGALRLGIFIISSFGFLYSFPGLKGVSLALWVSIGWASSEMLVGVLYLYFAGSRIKEGRVIC